MPEMLAARRGAPRAQDAPRSVALLTHRLTSTAFANLTRTLASGFRDLGVPGVYLVHLRTGNEDGPERLALDERIVRVRLRASRSAAAPLAIARFLRATRPDLVITMPSIPSLAALAGWSIAGRPGKLIVSEHAVMSYESWVQHRREPKVRMVPHLARLLYPMASGVHAVSEGVLEDLLNRVKVRFDPRRTAVIPNPLDAARVRRLSREDVPHPWLEVDRTVPVVVAVGRLVTVKNYGLLIEALERLLRRGPVRLIVLGEGPERPVLEAAIRARELGHSVDLRGFEPNPYRYMARADALALTSDEEGCPLVVAEAMACGVPVVATDTAGARELIEDRAGILSPVGDALAFADALELVLSDRGLQESLKEKGAERVSDLAPDRIAHRWLTFAASLS